MQRRARHDTLQPAGIIQMNQEWSGRNGPANYRRLYEAYFDQPIVVKDSFWISGTENNNYMTAIPEEAELDEITIIVWHDVKQAHPLTYYYTTIVQNCQECRCVPGYHYERFTFDDAFNHDTYRLHPNWWRDYGDYFPNDQMEIMFLFPIFDTTFTGEDTTTVEPPEHDTCLPSYGLRVTNYNPELPIVLWSTPYGVHQWDLSLARQGQSADEGEITHHTQTYTTFEGLDTGVWYTVWVRSVCDSGIVSVWSDSVDFYIAGDSVPSEPEGIVTADDIYTQFSPNPARESVTLFSSFQIRNVEAFDMGGKKVMELPARANNINIDIRSLAKGTYVVRVTTVHGVTVKKLIVE